MRIVIAEDNVLLREGISRLLTDSGHEVVGAVAEASGLLSSVAALNPDLAVVDVRMPPTFTDEGIRAATLIREQNPDVGVLVLSQYVEERYASELIAGGGASFGYLLKDRVADVGDFLDAVEEVAAGGTVLDPEVVSQILVRSRKQDGLAGLSGRSAKCSSTWHRASRTPPSPRRCTCPPEPWRSTSARSSRSSASPQTQPRTAASSPSCVSWTREQHERSAPPHRRTRHRYASHDTADPPRQSRTTRTLR